MELEAVLARRLAVQGLTGPPHEGVETVVGGLLAVQAQDAPLARWSLAMRTGRPPDTEIRAALDAGVVRTHVLRPTWHFVRAEDLRWLLALTSPKVKSSMAAQLRRLGLEDPAVVAREHAWVLESLRGGHHQTRRELARDDLRGEALGVVLLLAELDGLICSGPLDAAGRHTYALVDERVPPTPAKERDDAVRELVLRFFTGHGPASVAHLVRWCTPTKREVTTALADLEDELTSSEVDGVRLWYSTADPPDPEVSGTWLLPVFDEAYLTYPESSFPRVADHPWGDRGQRFAESGGGVIISDLRDVGWWKRTETGTVTTVTLGLHRGASADTRRAVEEQAEALAAFTGRVLEVVHPTE